MFQRKLKVPLRFPDRSFVEASSLSVARDYDAVTRSESAKGIKTTGRKRDTACVVRQRRVGRAQKIRE
jgi:hypothetical protein